ISVPRAVTPSYTGAYHVALLRGSLQRLPCPSLPRCIPCSVPGHLLRPMPASGFRVLVPVTSGRTGAETGGKFEIFKKFHFLKNYYLLCPVPCLHFDCSF
ncbi:unnamed protein product, partial [Staurois parvus]